MAAALNHSANGNGKPHRKTTRPMPEPDDEPEPPDAEPEIIEPEEAPAEDDSTLVWIVADTFVVALGVLFALGAVTGGNRDVRIPERLRPEDLLR